MKAWISITESAEEMLTHPSQRNIQSTPEDTALENDARELHNVVSELVRVYQFRDRKRIYYYDVSATQCYALSMLILRGTMPLNKLAAALHLDKSTSSRLVDSLEQKGYVRRTASASDARSVCIGVTPSGEKLHARIEQDLVDEMKELLKSFDSDVRQAMTRLVARLTKAAKERFASKTTG